MKVPDLLMVLAYILCFCLIMNIDKARGGVNPLENGPVASTNIDLESNVRESSTHESDVKSIENRQNLEKFVSRINQNKNHVVYISEEDLFEGIDLVNKLFLYESDNEIKFAELAKIIASDKFEKPSRAKQNHGYSQKFYYGFFVINNESKATLDLIIELDHIYTNIMKIYTFAPDGQIASMSSGLTVSYQARPMKDIGYAFPVRIKPGSNLFVFEQTGINTLQSNLILWSERSYFSRQNLKYIFISFAVGGMFIIGCYNLLLFISIREIIYLLYSIYVFANVSFQLYSFQLIPKFINEVFNYDMTSLSNRFVPITVMTVCITTSIFSTNFLHLRYRSLKGGVFVLFSLVLTASLVKIAFEPDIYTILVGTAVIPSGVVLHSIFCALTDNNNRSEYIKIFLLAWVIYLIGAFGHILNNFGLIGKSFLTDYGLLLGSLLENCLLSLALADQIRILKRKLTIEQSAKQHSYDQLIKVFYSHQLEMIKSGIPLEKTMPTTSGEACVISFDIVNSSSIKHIKAKDFFRNIFRRCSEIMMDGYNDRDLKARGYRIKEMGDGFLCSVGYPFGSLSDNIANDALDLAYEFSKILEEESQMLQSEVPICCGIGIALDNLQGFYPESGAKEYDIYGRAIVLATRYEGMRKSIFKDGKSRSVIIIQERVFHSIDVNQRGAFHELDLSKEGLAVRDDPAAKKIYIRCLDDESFMVGSSLNVA